MRGTDRLDMAEASVIERAARVLAPAASSPARVILLGLGARGAIDQDSDLDFLAIEREVSDRIAEAVRLRAVLGDIGMPGRRRRTRRGPRGASGQGPRDDGPPRSA